MEEAICILVVDDEPDIRRICRIRFTASFLKNFRNWISDMYFISAAMTPWIR